MSLSTPRAMVAHFTVFLNNEVHIYSWIPICRPNSGKSNSYRCASDVWLKHMNFSSSVAIFSQPGYRLVLNNREVNFIFFLYDFDNFDVIAFICFRRFKFTSSILNHLPQSNHLWRRWRGGVAECTVSNDGDFIIIIVLRMT